VTGRHRVVVTGIGLASPIGHDLREVSTALQEGKHGIGTRPDWDAIGSLGTRLAAEVKDLDLSGYVRHKVRTMGRVALLANYATQEAIDDAGLEPDLLGSGRLGLAYGSTHGSSSALESFCKTLFKGNDLKGLGGSAYLKFMSHTCVANLAQYYGIRGRVLSTCAACVSASQAIGAGYELVKHGLQEVMICGGAEEMHYTHVGVFDLMYATSTHYNDEPDRSPRPFDVARDGLVVGEGAGTLVLETWERAAKRGARVYGEIVGYGTNCDGTHVTTPSAEGMAAAMRLALDDAEMSPQTIQYINAHATGTTLGDIAESQATMEVVGGQVAISSTKGHTAHTLGACGAIEAAFCLVMIRDGFVPPTRNLETVDPRCSPLNYLRGETRSAKLDAVMSNNFAFGGINTSLIIRRA
jgi:3-oxoacyl-[acyl-carrier-protein] synthase II